MTKLLIARHGNNFDKGDVVCRVGLRTDLPLSVSGRAQAQALGHYLKQHHPDVTVVFASHLKRTHETAAIALSEMGLSVDIAPLAIFNEIDYGPDEGKPEEEVIERVGLEALKHWESDAIPPEGWIVDPKKIQQDWIKFSKKIVSDYPGQTVLVVTSNGVARFAPIILGDFEQFKRDHAIKLSTGAVACFVHEAGRWSVEYWNQRPAKCV